MYPLETLTFSMTLIIIYKLMTADPISPAQLFRLHIRLHSCPLGTHFYPDVPHKLKFVSFSARLFPPTTHFPLLCPISFLLTKLSNSETKDSSLLLPFLHIPSDSSITLIYRPKYLSNHSILFSSPLILP